MVRRPIQRLIIVALKQLLLIVSDSVPTATLYLDEGVNTFGADEPVSLRPGLLPRASGYFLTFTVLPLGLTWYQSPTGNIKPEADVIRVNTFSLYAVNETLTSEISLHIFSWKGFPHKLVITYHFVETIWKCLNPIRLWLAKCFFSESDLPAERVWTCTRTHNTRCVAQVQTLHSYCRFLLSFDLIFTALFWLMSGIRKLESMLRTVNWHVLYIRPTLFVLHTTLPASCFNNTVQL